MTTLAQALGPFGLPADLPGWVAVGAAAYFALRAVRAARHEPLHVPASSFVMLGAFAAAFLSLGYVAHYLRGGPRIIDATTYFLQARALAHGAFSWAAPDVSASFRGRFLLFHEPSTLAGIFPPGYPLLLALGFKLGAPMVIGPMLAAALVVATYRLAREIAHDHPEAEGIARLAAVLSVACAALRYHTADTMSHGAAALAVTVALASALHGRRTGSMRAFALAGAMVGWTLSIRMVSALPIGLVAAFLAFRAPRRRAALAWLAASAVPGVLLLLAANRAATGSAFTSTQLAYYAASDGPPGCFRYGLGKQIGCLFEHKDFVAARLPNGYTLFAALGTTLRRLRMHLTDVANFEPLALLVLVPRTPRAKVAQSLVLLQVLFYLPFYFDGNYPGGGARLFADVLPAEHALAALAMAKLAGRGGFARAGFALLSLATLGFAVHASHDHLALAARDGGRPMFEPERLAQANVTHGLVFFETDHGQNLAFDPSASADRGVVAARLRGDDHDRLLQVRLGHPDVWVYKLEPGGPTVTRLPRIGTEWDPSWRFESEADWPPLAQSRGWVEPVWVPTGRTLALHAASPPVVASATLELPVPRPGIWRIRPTIIHRGSGATCTLRLVGVENRTLATWSWTDGARDRAERLADQKAELPPKRALLEMSTNGEMSLDFIAIDSN